MENRQTNNGRGDGVAFVGASLIDGNGGPVIPDAVVLVKGKDIRAVGEKEAVKVPPSYRVIDLEGKTLMPGMIDSHVHLYWNGEPNMALHVWRESTAMRSIKSVTWIQRALRAGFTSLRSGGEKGYLDVALRDARAAGLIWGARVTATGCSISGTGGHADLYPPWLSRSDEVPMIADGIAECIRAVRKQIKMKVEWVKFHASGGVMDPFSDPQYQEYNDKEMKAIVNEAHGRGKFAFAHAQGPGGIRAAVKAGVDSIEHGMFLEDDVIEKMIKKDIFLCPTLIALYRINEAGEAGGIPPESAAKGIVMAEAHVKSFQKACKAGVKIIMGTDCGSPYNYHGNNAHELELMVRYGMSEMEAIISATKRAAENLRKDDKLGTVEPGKWADLIVVDGNPLKDIKCLVEKQNIKLVMQDGKIFHDEMTGAKR